MNELKISDISGLRRVFAKANFDVNRFVRNTVRDGHQATESMVEKLSRMSEDASNKMKRAIFENYKLFIKAGKAATELDATMHQINSDFTEKERVMNALAELSLFNEVMPEVTKDDQTQDSELIAEANRLSEFAGMHLNSLANVIEGAANVADGTKRRIVLDGELRELSVDNHSLICVARLFLLNDLLLVAYSQSGRSATSRYRIQTVYPLESLDVVSVVARDRRHAPLNSFKISVDPITRLFQADTAASKQTWLRVLEETKRAHVGLQSGRHRPASGLENEDAQSVWPQESFAKVAKPTTTPQDQPTAVNKLPHYALSPANASADSVREAFKALSSTLPECTELLGPPPVASDLVPARRNPFGDSTVPDTVGTPSGSSVSGTEKSSMAWIWDVAEDLDVAISERNFDRATELIVKARLQIDRVLTMSETSGNQQVPLSPEKLEELLDSKPRKAWLTLSSRIRMNEANLAEALEYELITAADRHGAPRSIRAAVLNLDRLGKGTLAAQLFLVYRSNLMTKTLTRGVRQEGNQLVYLNRLSFAFHRSLAEASAEWQKAVVKPLLKQASQEPTSESNMSTKENQLSESLLSLRFCSWVLEETEKFSQQLRVLLMDSRSVPFYTMSLAAQRITAHAEKITELLGIDVRSVLHANLVRTWQRAAEVQARVLRDAVEHRAKHETWKPIAAMSAQEQDKYVQDLYELGLLNRISGGASLPLTTGTCQLVRSLHYFVQSGRLLDCEDLNANLSECVASILRTELDNYKRVLTQSDFDSKKPIILVNLEFLARQAIPKLVNPLNCLYYPDMHQVTKDMKTLLDQHHE
ncbi:exocyst complex component 8 [Paragonimus westermani]|uniref:Exocyst complex component 8 n=1 Tax=Paragonimus westermani TaxID=34504 RepID=A0A5J4N9F8_9TREM|nr:exocyst complex component 8 [Paragonimus westermani]